MRTISGERIKALNTDQVQSGRVADPNESIAGRIMLSLSRVCPELGNMTDKEWDKVSSKVTGFFVMTKARRGRVRTDETKAKEVAYFLGDYILLDPDKVEKIVLKAIKG